MCMLCVCVRVCGVLVCTSTVYRGPTTSVFVRVCVSCGIKVVFAYNYYTHLI